MGNCFPSNIVTAVIQQRPHETRKLTTTGALIIYKQGRAFSFDASAFNYQG